MTLILTRKKIKPVLHQYFYLEYIKTKQKKMYKCKQSSVKLHYACKAHNDIPGTHKFFYLFYHRPEVAFCSKMNCLPFVTPPTMSSTEYF